MRHICARLIDTSERVKTQQWPPRTHLLVCIFVRVCVCVFFVWGQRTHNHYMEVCVRSSHWDVPRLPGKLYTEAPFWTMALRWLSFSRLRLVTAATVTLWFIDIWINQHNEADISVIRGAYCMWKDLSPKRHDANEKHGRQKRHNPGKDWTQTRSFSFLESICCFLFGISICFSSTSL